MGLVRKLAKYAVDEQFEKLPATVVEQAKKCLLDSFASMISGHYAAEDAD